ncbi:MAG: hypothetical protein II164_05750, partial [Firmicutes bacterium]|nr:hypothetical protein [Bacillota bacterium]
MSLVKLTKEDHIAVVTMSHAPINVLSFELLDEMAEVFSALEKDEGVWVKEHGLNIADNGVSLDKGNTLAWQAASMDVYAEAGNTYVIE